MSIKRFFHSFRGDTLIEVSAAITVFCLISVLSISLMNRDLSTIQGSLELSTARHEINAQAEALRFIHNSYLADLNLSPNDNLSEYGPLWHKLTSIANNPAKISKFTTSDCSNYYNINNKPSEEVHNIFSDKAFILNTRKLTGNNNSLIDAQSNSHLFRPSPLLPRVLFNQDTLYDRDISKKVNISSVEGIWIIATRDVSQFKNPETVSDEKLKNKVPEYYDFHIRACWYAPARSNPTVIGTIVRLYNPDYQASKDLGE